MALLMRVDRPTKETACSSASVVAGTGRDIILTAYARVLKVTIREWKLTQTTRNA